MPIKDGIESRGRFMFLREQIKNVYIIIYNLYKLKLAYTLELLLRTAIYTYR